MLAQHLAVVGGEDDGRVLGLSVLLHRGHGLAHPVVDERGVGVVERPRLAREALGLRVLRGSDLAFVLVRGLAFERIPVGRGQVHLVRVVHLREPARAVERRMGAGERQVQAEGFFAVGAQPLHSAAAGVGVDVVVFIERGRASDPGQRGQVSRCAAKVLVALHVLLQRAFRLQVGCEVARVRRAGPLAADLVHVVEPEGLHALVVLARVVAGLHVEEVVFADEGRAVPGPAQAVGPGALLLLGQRADPVADGAVVVGVAPSDPRDSRRAAQGAVGVRARERDSPLRERVHVGSVDRGILHAERVRSLLVGGDEEDVGSGVGHGDELLRARVLSRRPSRAPGLPRSGRRTKRGRASARCRGRGRRG